MTVNDFMSYMETNFPLVDFSSGFIDRDKEKVIGIYLGSSASPVLALGGVQNTSYNILPITILVHWTESSSECEGQAKAIYNFLLGKSDFNISSIRIVSIQMLESSPVNIQRDEKNYCEMVIRCNIIYSK